MTLFQHRLFRYKLMLLLKATSESIYELAHLAQSYGCQNSLTTTQFYSAR